jgi:predicted metal-dependent peptidase
MLLGSMDDHDGWADIDPEVTEELRDKVRSLVEAGVRRADQNNSWGSVPQQVQEYIRKMISREVDWKSIIRNFIGRSRTVERNSTIKRVNKKMPYIQPGVKRPMRANFACFVDQSGSMSDDDIALLFGELGQLANLTQLDVYHFDTEIDEASHKVWKRGDNTPRCLRTRSGGTDFQAIANFCNDQKNRNRWSGVIILTDGYAPKMGPIAGARVLWVVTPTGTLEHVRPGDLACQMKKDSGKFKSY